MVDLILVNGLPGSGKTTLANGLERLLDAPLIAKDAIKEAVADVIPAAPGSALGMAWAWPRAARCGLWQPRCPAP
jgi:predicted kinase